MNRETVGDLASEARQVGMQDVEVEYEDGMYGVSAYDPSWDQRVIFWSWSDFNSWMDGR